MAISMDAIETLIVHSAMNKEQTWEFIEELTELDYEEFEQMWASRQERVVRQ